MEFNFYRENMDGLSLIRLFSDSKEKFLELRQLMKTNQETDVIRLNSLKQWFEREGKSVEQLLSEDSLKLVDRMMLEKLGRDYKASIKKINSLISQKTDY
jgi:hypothetical protein